MSNTDVIVIGAGAAGLMCAAQAGRRGRSVRVLDQAPKAGRKILMSGGGRCNFTNYDVGPEHYLCHNPHFCKSALSRFSQWDFLALVERYQIPFEERDHGQLFCLNSARDILDMLLEENRKAGTRIDLKTEIQAVEKLESGRFRIKTSRGEFSSQSLVIATGGLSIPTMGASPFGYRIARQFGIAVQPTQPGLVPFTFQNEDKARLAPLAGIAVDSRVSNPRAHFRENLLFTHRGLSGPAILQISSYWQAGESVEIDLLPELDLETALKEAQAQHPQQRIKTCLGQHLPKRLVTTLLDADVADQSLANASHRQLAKVARRFKQWQFKPNGTEGYRTAEVTTGGVDCDAISSKTMEARAVTGLYFIGEVLDVTGWLGGYNLQWAWSSGWCAGQYC